MLFASVYRYSSKDTIQTWTKAKWWWKRSTRQEIHYSIYWRPTKIMQELKTQHKRNPSKETWRNKEKGCLAAPNVSAEAPVKSSTGMSLYQRKVYEKIHQTCRCAPNVTLNMEPDTPLKEIYSCWGHVKIHERSTTWQNVKIIYFFPPKGLVCRRTKVVYEALEFVVDITSQLWSWI